MLTKLSKYLKSSISIKHIPAILFVVYILCVCGANAGIIIETVPVLLESGVGLKEIPGMVEMVLQSDISGKYFYVDLNGLTANVLDINGVNLIQKLDGGSLTLDDNVVMLDQTGLSDKLKGLDDYLGELGIEMLVVPVPNKSNFYATKFAPGHGYYEEHAAGGSEATSTNDSAAASANGNEAASTSDGAGASTNNINGNANVRNLVRMLDEQGVPYIDMDAWFEENGWTIDDVYFRTDHHWRPEAAFEAVKLTMEKLEGVAGVTYERWTLDESNWKIDNYEKIFLGSRGKRVGKYYGGVDDFTYRYPLYETEYSVVRIKKNGSFEELPSTTVYDESRIAHVDYFNENPYCLFVGGDYPVAYIFNEKAVNESKVMVVGDSFKLPYECFLSTQFSKIYHVDTRHMVDTTFYEFVDEVEPDIVIVLFSGPNDGKHLEFR